MSKQLTNTGIPTAGIFGMERARGFNPIKGCENKDCHLHPVNTGECSAAQMCNRMAGPWASHEANYIEDNGGIRDNQEWGSKYYSYLNKLKYFHPAWLESQFQKQFPKERSCILVGYMTDIAFIPRGWVQRIIDKIKANNKEREAAGLLLHVFQFLTKDPTVYQKFKLPKNCQLGFTATNQDEFDSKYRIITDPFGKYWNNNLKYAYLEPLRDKIKLSSNEIELKWVIVGGGPEPLDPYWVRSIRDECVKLGIPFFFKGSKWSTKRNNIERASAAPFKVIDGVWYYKEKKSKNILDGKTWKQFPEAK